MRISPVVARSKLLHEQRPRFARTLSATRAACGQHMLTRRPFPHAALTPRGQVIQAIHRSVRSSLLLVLPRAQPYYLLKQHSVHFAPHACRANSAVSRVVTRLPRTDRPNQNKTLGGRTPPALRGVTASSASGPALTSAPQLVRMVQRGSRSMQQEQGGEKPMNGAYPRRAWPRLAEFARLANHPSRRRMPHIDPCLSPDLAHAGWRAPCAPAHAVSSCCAAHLERELR